MPSPQRQHVDIGRRKAAGPEAFCQIFGDGRNLPLPTELSIPTICAKISRALAAHRIRVTAPRRPAGRGAAREQQITAGSPQLFTQPLAHRLRLWPVPIPEYRANLSDPSDSGSGPASILAVVAREVNR